MRLARAELETRPFVEVMEREILPRWLLNDRDMTTVCKLELAFEFRLTRGAIMVLRRMKKLKMDFDNRTLAETLTEVYDASSDVFSHKKKVRALILEDDEWEKLFEKVRVNDPVKQDLFKQMVQPFTKDESRLCLYQYRK